MLSLCSTNDKILEEFKETVVYSTENQVNRTFLVNNYYCTIQDFLFFEERSLGFL